MQVLNVDQLEEVVGGSVQKEEDPPQFDNFGRPTNPSAPILWDAATGQ